MKVQFSDLSLLHRGIRKEINQAINKVLRGSDFILGKDVGLLEKEFASFCHTYYAVGVSSGTDALFLALRSLDIGQTDEVIVPAFTYMATALAVTYTGAKPVFVDIEEKTYNIDVNKIRGAITKNTKAIIPVHLYGQPANMPEILKIAKEYKLKVIEDAAQAHGASIKMPDEKWHITGGIGDIGCFSFYPSKNLGAMGDAGMLVTNDKEVYDKLLVLRNCGRISKYEHTVIGYNARLDTLQAAILRIKLKKLNKWNDMRIKAAKTYNRLFKNNPEVITPSKMDNVKHIYHVYAIRTKKRDEIFKRLEANGVGVIVHYPIALHLQRAYQSLGYKKGDFPVSENVAKEIISLPMFPHLREKQIEFIVGLIKKTLDK